MSSLGRRHVRGRAVATAATIAMTLVGLCVAAALALGSSGRAAAAPAPSPPPPSTTPDNDVAPPLVPVPAGCLAPPTADVVFVGEAVAKDFERVRYRIQQLRAGSTSQYSVGGLVDVIYLEDAKFLDEGEQYLVGARFDAEYGALRSTIRPDEPLFGGNDVIGLEDTDLDCPVFDDPVRTLQPDGTPVDSGVLSPMFEDRRRLFATIGVPTAIVFGVLAALVVLRWMLGLGARGVFALGRAAVTPVEDHRAVRVRTHRRGDGEG